MHTGLIVLRVLQEDLVAHGHQKERADLPLQTLCIFQVVPELPG